MEQNNPTSTYTSWGSELCQVLSRFFWVLRLDL